MLVVSPLVSPIKLVHIYTYTCKCKLNPLSVAHNRSVASYPRLCIVVVVHHITQPLPVATCVLDIIFPHPSNTIDMNTL